MHKNALTHNNMCNNCYYFINRASQNFIILHFHSYILLFFLFSIFFAFNYFSNCDWVPVAMEERTLFPEHDLTKDQTQDLSDPRFDLQLELVT